ncbi:MAG TPA: hypothetical protein VL974_12550 [Magnetospirillum sp.]|nr:hypothetical protein [Magnetospirillum sp.]
MDYDAVAKQLWEQLDREHDGSSIVKDEYEAMEWGELPPQVRIMLRGVTQAFLERIQRNQHKPPRKEPDFAKLAGEAMANAPNYQSIPEWVAGTIAMAYRLGRGPKDD